MMFLPASMGAIAHAANAVSFVAASGASYIASGTSINSPSTPAGVQAGDGLFSIVYARSALTPPAGWTLVASQANTGTLTQTLYIYRRDNASSGDASTAFTWTQASSGRMGLAYVLVRSTSGLVTVAQSSGAETDYASSTAYPQTFTVPALTAVMSGELCLMAATAEQASSGAAENTYAISGATVRTTQPQADNRLAAFTQARNSGQANASSGTFTAGAASANYYSTLAVRLQAG